MSFLYKWLLLKVKVKDTLRRSVYHRSVRLGVKPLENCDQSFHFQLNPCGHSPYVTSFLTRGWICLVWIGFTSPLSSVRIAHKACFWKFFLVHYIQFLCQSRLCKADHAYLTYLMLQRQLSHLTAEGVTAAKFKPHIFYVWLHLLLCCEYVHSHDFVWLLHVACPILLYDCIHMEGRQALCKSRTDVHLGKFPIVRRTLFCRRCNFKR
jgi:hypothetical protein